MIKQDENGVDQCRYGVFDYRFIVKTPGSDDVERSRLILFLWCPDTARTRMKMHYASAFEAIKNVFTGTYIHNLLDNIQFPTWPCFQLSKSWFRLMTRVKCQKKQSRTKSKLLQGNELLLLSLGSPRIRLSKTLLVPSCSRPKNYIFFKTLHKTANTVGESERVY